MISKKIKNNIIHRLPFFCRGVRKQTPEKMLEFISSEQYMCSQASYYKSVMQELGINPMQKKILEIGSGFGFFMVYAINVLKWDLYGIEPGNDKFKGWLEIAETVLDYNGIAKERLIKASGEKTNLEANTFDMVISNDVLEHVQDPEAVIREACRVLKPGGVLVFNFNNYRWVYEAHYNIFWLPFMSKPLAKKYVTWFRRDADYIDHLNFLNPGYIKKTIKEIPGVKLCLPLEYRSADFMIERTRAYIQCKENSKNIKTGTLFIKVLVDLFSMKILKRVMQIFARLTGIYHEMHLVLMKS